MAIKTENRMNWNILKRLIIPLFLLPGPTLLYSQETPTTAPTGAENSIQDQPMENTSPTESGTPEGENESMESDEDILERLERAADERLNGNKPFFYINPGFSLNYMQATITSRTDEEAKAVMTSSELGTTYHYDIVSTGYQITDWLGFNVNLSSHSFVLDRQIPEDSSATSTSDDDDDNNGIFGQDMGTRLVGHYSYIMPSLYLGGEEYLGFRLGLGVGYGQGWFGGTVQFRNTESELLLTQAVLEPSRSQDLVLYNLASGLVNVQSLDYVEKALLVNWQEPGNLERLGMYWTAKGYVSPSMEKIIQYQAINPDISPFEIAALMGLSHNNIRLSVPNLAVIQLYMDFPAFWNIHSRLYVDVPVFERNGYDFSITSFNVAFYYPVGIGL